MTEMAGNTLGVDLTFSVGKERTLSDILSDHDVMPLLEAALRSGATAAAVLDERGKRLWSLPAHWQEGGGTVAGVQILLEGEPVASVAVTGNEEKRQFLAGIATMLGSSLNVVTTANLKRMLTTEIHTVVVRQSYDDLLDTNRKLAVSEEKYRRLAETLEIKVAERTRALETAYAHLLQQEKMASVGRLAAGMAHEINNPIGFITSNLNTLRRYFDRFAAMLALTRTLTEPGTCTAGCSGLDSKWRELKLDVILADLPDMFSQTLGGAERIARIVADLRGFSHIDDSGDTIVDLNEEIGRTLAVLTHEIPQGTNIIRAFSPLPGYRCRAGALSQVFLNVITNALQAQPEGLILRITTAVEHGDIVIDFEDNGPGIPEEIAGRVFEPFFTTRDVGKGMGTGLTIAYDIVTAHRGTIHARHSDAGAAIRIRLPLSGEGDA